MWRVCGRRRKIVGAGALRVGSVPWEALIVKVCPASLGAMSQLRRYISSPAHEWSPSTAQGDDARPVAVFDLDGTLVDTAPDLAASLNHCLVTRGLAPVPLDRVRPYAGHGARVMLETAFAWAGHTADESELAAEIARFHGYYRAHITDLSIVYDGTREALDRLGDAGFLLAVCTNKTQALSNALLRALDLHDRFAAVCGSDTFHRRKPDPVHLIGTIARAGSSVHRAIMIGDTQTDVDAAWAAGIPSVVVDFGYDAGQTALARADAVLSSFSDLDATVLHRLLDRRRAQGGQP